MQNCQVSGYVLAISGLFFAKFCDFNKLMKLCLIFLSIFTFAGGVQAQENTNAFSATPYPVPRFVSLRSDKVFARTGPGKQYPVRYVYTQKNLPVEIILEFQEWRKIRDIDGGEGWVHQALVTGKRFAFVQAEGDTHILKKQPNYNARSMVQVENGALLSIEKCIKGNWCHVSAVGYDGWIERNFLWGVYENEFFD